MVAVLKITDGTTEVDLLQMPGFLLESWRPALPQYKGGGTFQSSPLLDGRQLVNKQLDNYIESFSFKVQAESQDALIFEMRGIRRLLEKATNYWTTKWQTEPVWLEARASCETNTRYAHIVTGYIPEDENPYAQPFGMSGTARAVMDDMTLIIEHGPWFSNEPGTATQIAVSGFGTFNGNDYGTTSGGNPYYTTTNKVYVANKHNLANISHIYYYDDNLGTWSGNLYGAALPYDLLPAVPAVGDALYVGCSTALADSGPFDNIVFNFSPGTQLTGNDGWTYWDGAAWSTMDEVDNTGALQKAGGGTYSVNWEQQDDWTIGNLNTIFGGAAPNVAGYWIQWEITALTGGAPTPPTEITDQPYSCAWGFIEVDDDAITGDLPALAKSLLESCDPDGLTAPHWLYANRAIFGLRSVDRGDDFRAYINLYETNPQTPTGVTVTLGTYGADAADLTIPVGGRVDITPLIADTWSDGVYVSFSSAVSPQWYGQYHAFLRGRAEPGGSGSTPAGTVEVRLQITAQNPTTYTESGTFSDIAVIDDTYDWRLIDCGKITLPATDIYTPDDTYSFNICVQLRLSDLDDGLRVYDLVLIPVDEWSGDFTDLSPDVDSHALDDVSDILLVDSITNPKTSIRAYVYASGSGASYGPWSCRTAGPMMLQANTQQRLWSLLARYYTTDDVWDAPPNLCCKQRLYKQQKYFSMRGVG